MEWRNAGSYVRGLQIIVYPTTQDGWCHWHQKPIIIDAPVTISPTDDVGLQAAIDWKTRTS